MKKNYTNPALTIISLEDVDIVTTSDVPYNNVEVSGVQANSKQRENIWDE